jgi:hypothetical protein
MIFNTMNDVVLQTTVLFQAGPNHEDVAGFPTIWAFERDTLCAQRKDTDWPAASPLWGSDLKLHALYCTSQTPEFHTPFRQGLPRRTKMEPALVYSGSVLLSVGNQALPSPSNTKQTRSHGRFKNHPSVPQAEQRWLLTMHHI